MPRLLKKRSKKIGLPAGTLIHVGEKKTDRTRINIFDYNEQTFIEKEAKNVEECFSFKDKPTVTWIDIEGVHDVNVLEKLGNHYGFHPLILEDILTTDQRPKIEDLGEYIYIVLKMFYNGGDNEVVTEQISLILGQNFVVSFQEGIEGDVFTPVRERIKTNKGRIRKLGADFLAYALIDSIVDSYYVILERIEEKIETLEDDLVVQPSSSTLESLHSLKREMILLRKSVWPLREVINSLLRKESPLIQDSTIIYLKDIYDHTIQVSEIIETLRDILSGMLDIYLSSVSNRMNEVMKLLTIIATIFIPLTFIAGVYGMNFKYMPELEWPFGYFMVLAVMLGVLIFMLGYFRKKKWI